MKKVIITGILILVGILNGAAIYSVFANPVTPPSQDVIQQYPYQTMGCCSTWKIELMCTATKTSEACKTHCSN